tara:strand:+ start:46401 stop:47486 length:1086 start_codon:yes stop_codon:yes gene_type:complete
MKIALLGDIAFFGKFSLTNNENLFNYFEEVSSLLKNYDLVIGNLETPFVTNQKEYGIKSAFIKSDPINVTILKQLNIDVLNLANNHIYDYGIKSYELTKSILDEHKIKYFGIENKQLLIEKDSAKIAIHGYCCYSTNPLGINNKSRKGVNELNFNVVKNNLLENTTNGYYNIIGFHCGQEHVNYPNYDHIKMGRELAKVAPYVFYGHHPHVVQGIEKHNGSLLAYSLGNFCFDDVYTKKSKKPLIKQSINNRESFILELNIENGLLEDYKVIPIFIGKDKIEIGNKNIEKKIAVYSKKLTSTKESYINYRSSLINTYINKRKAQRNFQWYFKRLNYRSFFLIINAIRNSKKYSENLKKYLN